MRKLLTVLIGLAIMVAFTMSVGCKEVSAKTEKLHYKKIEMNFTGSAKVYVDPETGVQYIVFADWFGKGYGIGITPRLDADGKPMVGRSVK